MHSTGSSTQARCEPNWMGVEEASPFTGKKTTKRWSSVVNATLVVLIMTMPPLLILLSGRLGAPAVWIKSTVAGLGTRDREESKKDVLLGGLLVPGFDKQSCASRYQSVYYRKKMMRPPSPYLIKRLREQEALQRRCGPGTEPYIRASEWLKSGQPDIDNIDGCSYLVLISYRGLGNRMLAMASAFLYAVLTNRVLLVDRGRGNTLTDLFCEPFPGTTWALPIDFPLEKFRELNEGAPESYGNVVVNMSGSVSGLHFVYLHLDHDASAANLLVYCDDHRQFLHRVQWAIMRADQYIAPGLFLNPVYQEELDRLFPRKDSVFYILSRYLLHPTNDIWGMVTRFYNSYLRNADERLGIQIRVFDGDKPFQHVLDQILACTSQEHLLPGVMSTEGGASPLPTAGARSKAVLMTGLSSWYHDNIREMYWKSASMNGEVVSVHQPSHEEHQHWFHSQHDMKALAEIYLLSLTDKIVTSGWSTFGYVGNGLGGLTPYIMFRPKNMTVPNPPCTRAMSMEPCSFAVPHFNCKTKEIGRDVLQANALPHLSACEDLFWGVKLTDPVIQREV
ncbi:probable fucosyltransferase 8 [Phragmites australis]|uniref:probable fucosyltransferase 8 n=1 Tax=Phragmites australis TaxID=29695 RepID=UPI002D76CC01|nr:probable fucosyltransferase 8 [Phragmites australis]